MLITSNKAIYITKVKKRKYVCRYSEFHVTHATIFSPLIIWFNPQHSKSVKTNIGRIFIKLVSKHFPPDNKFRKLFNKNKKNLVLHVKHQIKSERSQQKNATTQDHRASKFMQLPY